MLRRWMLLCAMCAVGAVACGRSNPAGRQTLRVAAASDLNAALGELIARFSAAKPIDVSASFGSSGTFFAQITNGAPFDIFLSADVEYPRRLAERGLTEGAVFTYAFGRLALWAAASSPVDVSKGLPALVDPAVKRVSIANPEHAPYGRAAVEALKRAGVYDSLQGKLVLGENVAQALQFAHSGAADAAIVALSLALAPASKERGRALELPADSHSPIEQGGAIVKSSAHVDAARAFRDYLTGPEARTILQQYGFSLPQR